MGLKGQDVILGAPCMTARSPAMFTGTGAGTASHPTLRVRAYGSSVFTLQRQLAACGYWLGAVDGQFDDLTRQAVVAIQKVAGLSRDGICGPLAWS